MTRRRKELSINNYGIDLVRPKHLAISSTKMVNLYQIYLESAQMS